MNTELHCVGNFKNVTASCEGWRKPLFVLWMCDPTPHSEAPIFKPQSPVSALSTKVLPAWLSVYLELIQSWETVFIFHRHCTALPSPWWTCFAGISSGFCRIPPRHGRSSLLCLYIGEGEAALAPRCMSWRYLSQVVNPSFWARSYCTLAPPSPSNLLLRDCTLGWWDRQQKGWRGLTCDC